ncbi:MAG TPA: effector-associated domain EAD1-containing protein [Thermoanaerobaculia bacterium]|nr:effector-associated domain EAD1-containing protein [Thermoanaerobaculia bacterium]
MLTLTPKQREKLMELIPQLFNNDDLAIVLYKLGLTLERIAGDRQILDTAVRKVLEDAEKKGKLRTLLDKLAAERKDVVELQVVAQEIDLAERIPDFREAALELYTVLTDEKVPDDLVIRAFNVTAPPLIQRQVDPRTTSDFKNAVVMWLAWQTDRSPLLQFAQLVKNWLDYKQFGAAVEKLTVWITTAMTRLGITEKQKRDLDAATAAELKRRDEQRLHLLVSVRQRQEDEYELSAWTMWVDSITGKSQRSIPHPGAVCKRNEIEREIVKTVWQAANDLFKDSPTPTLELFLPVHLLTIDPDRWDLGDADLPEMLGSRFSLLLRSWERSYATAPKYIRTRADWHERWKQRHNRQTTAVRFDAGPDPGGYSQRTRAEKIAFVALTFPPEDTTVRLVVMSGTPLAIWIRCEIPEHRHDVELFFDEIVAKHCEDFRERIFDARLRAAAGDYRNHLNLLWDDPERQPPDSIENAMMME